MSAQDPAPPRFAVGQRYRTQKELEEAKDRFVEEQLVPYTIGNSVLAEKYNRGVDSAQAIPVGIKWKEVTFKCKHFGKPRQHEHVEGKKRRPNQSTFKRGCPSKVNIVFNVKEQSYIVTQLNEVHENHELKNKELKKNYPEFRQPQGETVAEVEKLFEYEVKAHKIKNRVLNSGIKATSQDIQNLRNKWKAKFKGTASKDSTDTQALLEQLKILKEEDPHSVVVVSYDPESYQLQSVFFQTAEMRAALEMYPEVLITDITYRLTDNEMPLAVYEVIDCDGKGRIVGYAILLSEKKEIVTGALELLKLGHPDLVDKVNVVLIDKDQSEIAAIRKVLPNAEVHLCDYHVKDVFKKSSVRKMTDKDWNEVDPLIKKLIHAFSKEEYDETYLKLQSLVGAKSKFMDYFDRNWHDSPLIWTEYKRNMCLNFGERTTGRVESHNAKIKALVDKKMPVPMVIMRLRLLSKVRSVESERKLFNSLVKTRYHKYSDDPVIQKILTINTPFVGGILRRQYERSLQDASNSVHAVTCTSCDCAFFTKFKLTCCHIFRERKLEGVEIYDHQLIPQRWTVVLEARKVNGEQEVNNGLSSVEILMAPLKTSKRKVVTSEDRYNLSESICGEISTLIANFGGKQFEGAINALKTMLELLRAGKDVAIVGVQNNSHREVISLDEVQVTEIITAAAENTLAEEGQEPRQDHAGRLTSFSNVNPDIVSKLNMPPKPVVKGQAKGKRKATKKTTVCEVNSADEENAEDDPADNQRSTSPILGSNPIRRPQRVLKRSKILCNGLLKYPWKANSNFQMYSENLDYYVMNLKISELDCNSLSGNNWLTDKTIDCFVAMTSGPDFLCEPEAAILTLDSLILECASMGLQSILARAQSSNMIMNDLWIIPSHVNRNHWILLVVLVKSKKIIILDPQYQDGELNSSVKEHLQIVRLLLSLSYNACFGTAIVWHEWRIHAPTDLGVQTNSFDCGVCVCVWAYSIFTGSAPPAVEEICQSSESIRIWIRNELLSKAQKIKKSNPMEDITDKDDQIIEVYSEFDVKVAQGSLIIQKPWLELPPPLVFRGLIGGNRTDELLGNIMKNLWRATEKVCGVAKCLRVKKDMYLCEGCREYYHLTCIADTRKAPDEHESYFCPKHIVGKTKTRKACRPLRLRKSLE